METGLYTITSPSGNFYVGSTSRSFARRWLEHKTELRHHKHKNYVLQAAWDKYGEASMSFEVLLECLPDECEYYEQMALETLSPAYNLSVDVSAPFRNRKHTESAKIKCSKIWKGKKKPPFSEEHRRNLGLVSKGKKRPPRSKEWLENSSNAQIERWKNPTEKMLNKKHPSGYIHKNPRSIAHCEAIKTSLIGKGKLGDKNPAARSVKCIETGKVFTTIKAAAKWIRKTKNPKADYSNISSCCSGKLKSAYGYHWAYVV